MSAARIVGRHLWRGTVRYLVDGAAHMTACWLNITCAERGLGVAARSARKVMKTAAFRREYPNAVLYDMNYQGTIDS